MTKMKILLIMIFCFLSSSCSSQQNNGSDRHIQLINNLLTEGSDSPSSYYASVLLFSKSSDTPKIGYISVNGLRKIYNSQYSDIDYKEFLIKVLDQDIVLDSHTLDGCFSLNDTIMSSYKKESFSSFLENYNKKVRDGEYTIKAELSEDAKLTVFYYLFLNDYYTSFDDYIGLFYSRKMTDKVIETIEPVFEE